MSRRTWLIAALVAALTLLTLLGALAGRSLFWSRYLAGVGHAAYALPPGVLTPRARIEGGNEPPAPRVQPQLEGLDPQALARAADYAGSQGTGALIVSRHEHIVFERYWGGTGFDTVVDAQSFAPVLVALATGVALSRRELAFPDEPVGLVLDAWRADPRGAITLRNLLQMSSGLAPLGHTWLPFSAGAAGLYGTDITAVHLAQPLAAHPGERWLPQASDPQLLALVLERATHMSYAEYLSQTLWRPLGAGDAWLWLDRQGGESHVDRGLLARQGDWIRVAELLVKDGNYRGAELIRPGWIAQMVRPARGNKDYGAYLRLGVQAGAEPYATPVWVVGTEGGNRLWVVPSLGLSVLRIARAASSGWDDSRIPNLIIRGTQDFVPARAHAGTDLSRQVPQH
jgi:CubicO group peptidase (beta-lactamase class C family)